jgi:TP901 family phage tail tape measure protein
VSGELASLLVKLGLDSAGFQKGIQQAGVSTDQFASKTSVIGAKAQVAFAGAGAAAGAFAVDSVQEFAGFQQKMNEVFTLLPGISQDAMGKMTDDVLAFSQETGKLPDDVIPAVYQALSAGVPKDNVFDFLRTANQAAVGGVTSLEDSVNGLSSAVNAYGPDVLSADKASDIFFTTIRLGKTTFPELSAAMANVAPAAAALKIPLTDVNAAMATMTSQGEPTASASTKIRGAILELAKSGSVADKQFQAVAGKTFPEFIASGGTLQDALQLLKKQADDSGTGIQNSFGSVEAGMAAVMLTSDQGAATFSNNMDQMAQSTGATGKAFDTMSGGIQQQANKMLATIKAKTLEVGRFLSTSGLGPILTAFGPVVGKTLGAAIGGAGGLIAPKLGGMLAKVFGGATGIVSKAGSKLFAGLSDGAGTALSGLGAKLATNSAVMSGMDKLGGLMGSRLGTAMKGVAVLALAAIAAEEWGQLQQQIADNQKRVASINNSTSDYLAGMPSTADVQAKIDALKSVPEKLNGVQGALFSLGKVGEGNVLGSVFDAAFGANPAQVADDKIKQLQDYLDTQGAASVKEGVTTVADAVTTGGDAVAHAFDQYMQSFDDGSKQIVEAGQQLAKFDPDTGDWMLGKDFLQAAPDVQAAVKVWIAGQAGALQDGKLVISGELDQYVKSFEDGSSAMVDAGLTLAQKDKISGKWNIGPDIMAAAGDTQDAIEVWIEKQNGTWEEGASTLTGSIDDMRSKISDALQGIQDAFDTGLDTKKRKNMSGAKRLKQMADDIDTITKRLHKSIAANDPVNTAYWEQALITATGKYNAAKGQISVDSDQISSDLAAAGVDAKGVFKGLGKDATKAGNKVNTAAHDVNFHPAAANVGAAADDIRESMALAGRSAMAVAPAIRHADGPISTAARHIVNMIEGIFDVDFYSAGQHMIFTWSKGMWGSRQAVARVANKLAHIPADYLKFSAPPPLGPLHGIRSWGPHMIDEWLKPILPHGLGKVGSASYKLAEKWASGLRDNIFNSLSELEAGTNNAALGKAAAHLAARMRQGHGHKGAADAMFEALSELEAHGASKRQGEQAAALAKLLRKWAAPDMLDPKRGHRSADWYDTAAPIHHRRHHSSLGNPDLGDSSSRASGGDTYNFHIGTLIADDHGIDELIKRIENRKRRTTRGGGRLVGAF